MNDVTKDLLETLKGLMALSDHRVDLRDAAKAARAAIARAEAEAQQERLLQDMHDAGREIDRMLSKPQPDAESIMARDDVIRMALEAGFTWEPINNIADPLERFAALVAADVRARGQK